MQSKINEFKQLHTSPLAQLDGDSYYFDFKSLLETKYLEKLKTIIEEL